MTGGRSGVGGPPVGMVEDEKAIGVFRISAVHTSRIEEAASHAGLDGFGGTQ